MNIFSSLSLGNGRLDEENLSAMLGFLLAPTRQHGFGDEFLKRFLEAVDPERFRSIVESKDRVEANVFYEKKYKIADQTVYIDVEIRIYERPFKNTEDIVPELHRIVVENKIRPDAANLEQLKNEYLAVKLHLDSETEKHVEQPSITIVFLTPPGTHPRLDAEWAQLDGFPELNKKRLRWSRSDERSITSMLRDILVKEAEANISPIPDYIRHTIKGFVQHIEETEAGTVLKSIGRRKLNEGDDLSDELVSPLGPDRYKLQQYTSGAIRIFDADTLEEKVPTKEVLRKFVADLKSNGVEVSLKNSAGGDKNTQALGRDVIRELRKMPRNSIGE